MMDLQITIAVITLVGSAGIAWGISVTRLKSHEIRLAVIEGEHKTDHDLLIEIKTKLDLLVQGMGLVKK